MTEVQAKTHLRQMLRSLTPGSVLHLLAELVRESAQRAHRRSDTTTKRQAREVSATLFVVGLGIDAASAR